MTKEEALQKIKELEEYIKNIDQPVGYENVEIYLMSCEEYDKYKQKFYKIQSWMVSIFTPLDNRNRG